jgi:hypothetical protein
MLVFPGDDELAECRRGFPEKEVDGEPSLRKNTGSCRSRQSF